MVKNVTRLHCVIYLIILANVWNMIFPKGMGYEVQTGFEYEFSKYIYGGVILLMLPVLFSTKRLYFWKMKYMAFYVIIHIVVAIMNKQEFELGNYLKTIMICLSFVYFEESLKRNELDSKLLYAYILSIFINVIYLTLTQNRFAEALDNYGHIGGGQNVSVTLFFSKRQIFNKIYSFGFT